MPIKTTAARRIRWTSLAATLVVSATVVTVTSFGGTAFASTSVIVAPSGPYTNGQSVTVTGSGFPSRSADPEGITIIECADAGGSSANLPIDDSTCDATTANPLPVLTNSSGNFATSYSLVLLSTSAGSNIDCDATDYCVLWVGVDYINGFNSTHAFSTPFLMSPSGELSPQTITFSSIPPSPATVGGPAYAVSASASSGLPVSLTIDPSSSSVCSISGTDVSFAGVGTCTIDANQSGDGTFEPAPQVQQSFAVVLASTTAVVTSQVSESTIVLGPSAAVSDTATVQGNATNGTPTGTVAFYVCQTGTSQSLAVGPCPVAVGNRLSTSRAVAGSGDASSAGSGSFTPTSAGTWCFSAVYNSSSAYTSSSDNTTAGNLDANECVLVTPSASATATFVFPTEVTLGPSGTITDSVTVSGSFAGGPPTGSVAFYACLTNGSQTLTTGACAASGTPEDAGETLVAGAGDTSSATSSAFVPTAAGTWCFSAVYGGDGNYGGSTDNTSAGNLDPDECALVTPAASSTSSSVSSARVNLGPAGTITDAVTVTGNSAGGPPAGTVAFYVCGPAASDALCTSMSTPEGTPTLAASGSDTATASSSVFTASSTGVYCFGAVYVPAPDGSYTGSSDNVSGAVDADECATVLPALPTPYSFVSADSATAVAGQPFTFTIETDGLPLAKIKDKGAIPVELHFANNGNGTATISGIPKPRKIGVHQMTVTATFGTGKNKHVATQAFTLDIT